MAELFARYEINREPFWPVISKVLVGSLAFHLCLGVVSKYVPVARSIFNVSRNAADMEFVDEDYERTIVQNDVTLITLRNGKFTYPEGYFAVNDGSMPAPDPMVMPISAPPVIPLPPPLPVYKPLPPLPPVKRGPAVAKLPTPVPLPPASGSSNGKPGSDSGLLSLPGGPTAKNQPTPTPAVSPTPAVPASKDEANKAIDTIAAEKKINRPRKDKITMRPFNDLWLRINEAQAQQPLNWSGDAEVVMEGERTPENKLQPLTVVRWTGDPTLVRLLTDLVAAVGDSQAIQFMDGASKYKFTLKFTGEKFLAQIDGQTESPDKAKELAQAYGAMLFAGRIAKKGDDEEIYLNNARISANGKNVIVTLALPRGDTKELISKQLLAAANKAQQPPPAPTQQTP